MAQTSIFDSAKEKAGKFSVSVERAVNLGHYESLRIGLSQSFDAGSVAPDEAYKTLYSKVEEWASKAKPPVETTRPGVVTGPQVREPATSQPAISGEDPYLALRWKQSVKRVNLSTIMVSQELLANPVARELYDRLKGCKSFKVGQVTYRYSRMENGAEFLQKWG